MKTSFLFNVLLLFNCAVWSQAGKVDRSFGNNGIALTKFDASAFLNSIAIQADGKIVAANTENGNFALTRYTTNGMLDSSFGNNGKTFTDIGIYDVAMSVAIQSNGKIIAAGFIQNIINGFEESDFALVRYKTNGTPDSSFGINGIVTYDNDKEDFINSITLQPDGKIIVAGTSDNFEYSNAIVLRFNTNGSLDKAFGKKGKVVIGYDNNTTHSNDGIYQAALQADGKILLAGVTQPDTTGFPQNNILIRLNTDGSLITALALMVKQHFYLREYGRII